MVHELLANPALLLAIRVFLALVFATAALSKLGHAEEFYGVVRNFRILPNGASRAVALVLPVVELAVAAGLLIGATAVPAAIAAAALLAVFGAAIAVNVLRGRTWIDCGCFRNGLKQQVGWALVGRNALMAGAALAVAGLLPAAPGPMLAEALVGLMAGLTAMMLYLSAAALGGLRAAQTTTSKGR